MKLKSLIASRPLFIFILLAIGVLLLPCLVITWWYQIIQHMKDKVDLNAHMFGSGLPYEIGNTAKLLGPINSSATNLSRILSSSLNGTHISQSEIENKVAPILFQTFLIIPHISQVSYIGLEGSFFAYYFDGNQTFAMYSNSSTASSNACGPNMQMKCTWYKQPVDLDTGKLNGDASQSQFNISVNASWIQEALNRANGYASVGKGWNSGQDLIFLNSVHIHGHGVISLGFPVKTLINFFNSVDLYGGSLYLATQHGDVLSDGLPNTQMVVTGKSVSFFLRKHSDQKDLIGDVSCIDNGVMKTSILNIGEMKYWVYCSPLEIVGVQSVYALALPYQGLVSTVHKITRVAFILLMVLIAAVFISVLSFVLLMVRAATREIHLCSALIKQMEATQQAERKSMNKSLAFASASHDIRAALAGITGLIELSYGDASPGSELETNLQQMDDCAKDLVGLLNSVLDISKIEAGKMQIELEEFNLAHLLEDVVDLFHPVGIKKGVDIVLDFCDGSVLKFSCIKGDRGKLKQVLCNLLSNAVKFTFMGHVSVRVWAQNPSLENKILASSQKGLWKHLLCWFSENEKDSDMEAMNSMKQNPNCMEFVFEVDDTGGGIPKEKQKSVFENFVQVKETSSGQGGTGLGLGIVQSLVRLMGGEIGIVDKEKGERGTCFRFNTFLIASEAPTTTTGKGDIEMGRDFIFSNTHQSSGLTFGAFTPGFTVCNSSPRLSMLSSSAKVDGSHVVLLIQNPERQRIAQKFMEDLGIKVLVVNKWECLHSMLMKVKLKQNFSPYSSSGKSDIECKAEISSSRSKDVPLSAMDGIEQTLPAHRSNSILKCTPSFILLVIDASAGPFEELYDAVAEFKKGLHHTCYKVVWLDKPTLRSINIRSIGEDMVDPYDDILLKPLHGSRLYHVTRFLPEFRGNLHHKFSLEKPKRESTIRGGRDVKYPGSSSAICSHDQRSKIPTCERSLHGNIIIEGNASKEKHKTRRHSSGGGYSAETLEMKADEKDHDHQSIDKPLHGLRFLVAEDKPLLRKIAMSNLLRLGASVELCQNGEEALQLVRRGLQNQKKRGAYPVAPYDYILMDCEMPLMDGYEATRQIRREEKSYGIHMPIIALTAHNTREKVKTEEAGMDLFLCKPLKSDPLLEAIRDLGSK